MTFYIILFTGVVMGMVVIERTESPEIKKAITLVLFLSLILISGTRFELGGSDYYDI